MPHITSFFNFYFANVVFREFYETNKKVHFAVFDMILLQLQNSDYLYLLLHTQTEKVQLTILSVSTKQNEVLIQEEPSD